MKFLKNNLPFVPIFIFPIILFFKILINGRALFWGTPSLQFIPWHSLAIDLIEGGTFPFWNLYNGMGAPLAANYQTALFYPPNWLVLVVGWFAGDAWLAWAHTSMIVFHLIWMGIGISKILELLGYGKINRVIAGIAFSMCGYFVARTGFFSMIWAGAWLPWIIFAVSKITYPGCRSIPADSSDFNLHLALFLAMQLLAGHAQLTWYTLLLAAGWVIVGAWNAQRARGIWLVIKKSLLPGLLALGLSAVQLVITAEYLLISHRSSSVDFDFSMTYSFWPWRLLGFLLPDLFGNPGLGNYWGYASFWEDAIYIGVLPFFLAVLTIPRIWKSSPADDGLSGEPILIRFLWVTSIISILLALGKNTPIFPFLFRNVPSFDMFNSPARFMIWAEFCLVMLAGIGYNHWRKPDGKGLYWLRLATAGGGAITLGAFLAWIFLKEIELTFIRSTALCGLFALLTGILTLAMNYEVSHRRIQLWNIAVIIILGVDLCIANWELLPSVDKRFYETYAVGGDLNTLDSARVYMHPSDEHYIKFKRFFQFKNYQTEEVVEEIHYALVPNINILTKIRSVNNFDPLVSQRYYHWMERLNSTSRSERIPWFQLMNVAIEERRNRDAPEFITFKEINGASRFWMFGCADFYPEEKQAWTALVEMMEKQTDNFSSNRLIVEGDLNGETFCNDVVATVELVRENANYMLLNVLSDADGWLMISDTWYPGWQAKVNGNSVEIYKGNYAFRAVKIEQGENLVELHYSPTSFWLGLGFSLISIVLVFWIAFRRHIR